jgi:undecaprenyl-diphosphatase
LGQLRGILPVLHRATWGWVAAGTVTTALGFLAAAYTQFVAGRDKGSFKLVGLLQLTGAFINHFTPFNLGSVSLTTRYYSDIGESKSRAVAIALLPTIFGVVTTVSLVAIVSPVTLRHIIMHTYPGSLNKWFLAVAAIVIVGVLIGMPTVRRRIHTFTREVVEAVTSISLWPQLPALLFGSLALTFVSTLSLIFSAFAVHASINIIDAFTLYVTSSLVSNFAPTPGGIGATEAFLAIGLTSVGMSLPEAAAVTLVFRFVSFWIPIIPGILALRVVNRSHGSLR